MLEVTLTLKLTDTENNVDVSERLGVVVPVQDPEKISDMCERFFTAHMENLLVPTLTKYEVVINDIKAKQAAEQQRQLEEQQAIARQLAAQDPAQ